MLSAPKDMIALITRNSPPMVDIGGSDLQTRKLRLTERK